MLPYVNRCCERLPDWWRHNFEPVPIGCYGRSVLFFIMLALLGASVWISGFHDMPTWVIYLIWPLVLLPVVLLTWFDGYSAGYFVGRQQHEATAMIAQHHLPSVDETTGTLDGTNQLP